MRRKHALAAVVAACALAAGAGAAAQPSAACADGAAETYYPCSSCHGAAGEGSEGFGAPALAGLSADYVARQLGNFKSGLRGTALEDASGRQMALLAKTLRSPEAVDAAACYVATLPAIKAAAVLGGDPRRGRRLYAGCAACHGERAEGTPALGAPALAWQADWYLYSQLLAFRSGRRGSHPEDTFGAQMRAAVVLLPDDRAVRDVIAHIRSLR